MDYRFATDADIPLLAEWNHQLIRDEGHRNPMTVPELADRMRGWLAGEYRAVLFMDADNVGGTTDTAGVADAAEGSGNAASVDAAGSAAYCEDDRRGRRSHTDPGTASTGGADASASWSPVAPRPALRGEGGGHAVVRPGHSERPLSAWPGDVLYPIPAAYVLYRETDDEIYLRQFFVARNRRRTGIGRRAIALLHTRIWPTDKRFTLDVLVGNTTGIAFWRAVGYRDYCLRMKMTR